MRTTVQGSLIILIVSSASLACRSASSFVEDYRPGLDPADFVAGVDHPFFPLVPGTVYRFIAASEGETGELTVLPEKRRILGIDATVVHDRVWKGEKLKEETFDWYAQDRQGNVWYLGEDTREIYFLGITRRAGSWEAGRDGAQAGIIMKATPAVGDEYRQEYYAGEAEDIGKVLSLDESVTVPHGSFRGCLKTEDWTPLEKGDVEHKYYCRGIGLVLEMNANDPSERNELTAVTRR